MVVRRPRRDSIALRGSINRAVIILSFQTGVDVWMLRVW